MRSQVRQAFSALWVFRRFAGAAVVLQMASVAAESLAVLALGSLFVLSLETNVDGNVSGILDFPEKILSAFGFDLSINSIFLLILVLLVLKAVLQSSAYFIGNMVWTGFQKRYINELAEAYSFADWNYLAKQRSSTLLNIMFAEVSRAAGTMQATLTLVTASLSAAVYLAFAILVSPVAVGLFVLSFAILAVFLYPLLRAIRRFAGELIIVRVDLTQKINELLSGVKVMKALGSEERVQKLIEDDSSRMRRLLLQVGILREVSSATDIGIIVAVFVLFLVHLTGLEEALSVGVIGVILLRMSQRTQAAIATIGPIVEGLPSLESTTKTLGDLVRNREPDGAEVPAEKFSSLRFEDVSYGYVDGINVLDEVNFEVLNGQFVGIVGESGAGKTTLVDLMLGLLNPITGRVMVGDQDLSDLQRVVWRRRLGYVPQDVTLFHDTVYNNISAYRPQVTREDVIWAAEIAQASGFIGGLEGGYDHVVGDRGVRLSGGQRQRLALARALASRPNILLLDEATSSLDGHAEREFQLALENIRSQMTIIAIAHRIPTVMRADHVMVVSKGAIVESGPPQDLLKDSQGRFARLFAVQSSDANEASSLPEDESNIDDIRGD